MFYHTQYTCSKTPWPGRKIRPIPVMKITKYKNVPNIASVKSSRIKPGFYMLGFLIIFSSLRFECDWLGLKPPFTGGNPIHDFYGPRLLNQCEAATVTGTNGQGSDATVAVFRDEGGEMITPREIGAVSERVINTSPEIFVRSWYNLYLIFCSFLALTHLFTANNMEILRFPNLQNYESPTRVSNNNSILKTIPRSRRFWPLFLRLSKSGLWQSLKLKRITPKRKMKIIRQGGMDHLRIRAYEPTMTSTEPSKMNLFDLYKEKNKISLHIKAQEKCNVTPAFKYVIRLYSINEQIKILRPPKEGKIETKDVLKGLHNFGNTCHTNSVVQLIRRLNIKSFNNKTHL